MVENNEGDILPSQTQDPTTTETQNQAGPSGGTDHFRYNRHLEQISGCVGMIRNFTARDTHYTAKHFLQDFEEVAAIGAGES